MGILLALWLCRILNEVYGQTTPMIPTQKSTLVTTLPPGVAVTPVVFIPAQTPGFPFPQPMQVFTFPPGFTLPPPGQPFPTFPPMPQFQTLFPGPANPPAQNIQPPVTVAPVSFPARRECRTINDGPGLCVPPLECMFLVADPPKATASICDMGNNWIGLCCSTQPPAPFQGEVPRIPIPENNTEVPAMKLLTEQQVLEIDNLEKYLQQKGIVIQSGTPDYLHQENQRASPAAVKLRLSAHALESSLFPHATTEFIMTAGKNPTSTKPSQKCDAASKLDCKPSIYRSIDGTCNNPKHETWGSAFTPYNRLLNARYTQDGSTPRSAYDGSELPSARNISVTVFKHDDRLDPVVNVMFAVWAQFITSDMIQTPISPGFTGIKVSCCHPLVLANSSLLHPCCLPISVAPDDPFYSQFNVTCLEFVRSLPVMLSNCQPGPRTQLNEVTGLLDGSTIYGSDMQTAKTLQGNTGRLKTSKSQNMKEYLPLSEECQHPAENVSCYMSGDHSVNQQAQLGALYTLFHREHNQVAIALNAMNPQWDEDTLYQETRRIVVAQIQHITYNEFLPLLLGEATVTRFGLVPDRSGHSQTYDSSIDPSVLNEFAAGAMRIGHNMIPSTVMVIKNGKPEELWLRNELNRPYNFQIDGSLDEYIMGMTTQHVEQVDDSITGELTGNLFAGMSGWGLDLMAADVQRGRDHGLPPYLVIREACGLMVPTNFDQLTQVINKEQVDLLQTVYSNVSDIDMLVGCSLERHMQGAMIGPTCGCVIAEQFRRTKRGDRFWYENPAPVGFNPDQLFQIRQSTMARIICNAADQISWVPELAMISSSGITWNKFLDCAMIPKVNLEAWRVKT